MCAWRYIWRICKTFLNINNCYKNISRVFQSIKYCLYIFQCLRLFVKNTFFYIYLGRYRFIELNVLESLFIANCQQAFKDNVGTNITSQHTQLLNFGGASYIISFNTGITTKSFYNKDCVQLYNLQNGIKKFEIPGLFKEILTKIRHLILT